MKKILLLVTLTITFFGFSQTDEKAYEQMIESEMKSASKLMAVSANPNTLNYDITYQKLEFTVNPANYFISGKVTHTFTAITNMNTVTFDLYKKTVSPFTITSVKMNGSNLVFSYLLTHELVITLPSTLISENSATVEIIYSGAPTTSPSDKGFFTGTHSGSPVLWTLSEPFGARTWWPCKNDLNDKVDVTDIYITAPVAYSSVANGVEPQGFGYPLIVGGNKTTYFKHNYPIPSYLVAIAVTNYQVFNQTAGTTSTGLFPIINYLYPEEFSAVTTGTTNTNALPQTPSMINFFETIIGPYPYRNEKYGHARAGLNGGMEHATVSFMNSWSRGLIAHELAHQWFGDKITCGTWKDIWLNESITEYMAGCFVEHIESDPSVFVNWKNSRIIAGLSYGGFDNNLYLTDSQAMNVDRIFNQPITYYKGALVVNMLRFKMGSANFFLALRNYLTNFAYKYAITTDFKSQLEAVYGSSLNEFFNDWVYGLGNPTYNVIAQNIGNGQIKFIINQTQSDPSVSFFEMPVTIRAIGSAGEQQDFILNVTANGQEFTENVGFSVASVVFDPNKEIFSQNNTTSLSTSKYDYIAQSILVYPNPSSDILHITIPNSIQLKNYTLYNSLGQKVLHSKSEIILINSLTQGIYSIEIETSEGLFHKNFIKK